MITAVSPDWVREQIAKSLRTWISWSAVALLISVGTAVFIGVTQVMTQQAEFAKSLEGKHAAFAEKQNANLSDFKVAIERNFAEFKGQVNTEFARANGKIDKVDSQITDVKENLRRIEAKLDKLVAGVKPPAQNEEVAVR